VKAPAAGVFASLLVLLTVMPAEAALRLRPYLTGLFASPVAIVQDPTDPTVQFVVEQVGRIRVVKNGAVLATDFLDLRGSVLFGGERGLFSIAFPPDTAASGRFYVNFTRSNGGIVVARFQRTANPLVADPGSRFDLVWPDGNAFIIQTCKAPLNFSYYCDPEVDALHQEARRIGGLAARKPVYEKIAAKVLPGIDGGFLYLWHAQVLIALSGRIEGYRQMPDGLVRVIGLKLK